MQYWRICKVLKEDYMKIFYGTTADHGDAMGAHNHRKGEFMIQHIELPDNKRP